MPSLLPFHLHPSISPFSNGIRRELILSKIPATAIANRTKERTRGKICEIHTRVSKINVCEVDLAQPASRATRDQALTLLFWTTGQIKAGIEGVESGGRTLGRVLTWYTHRKGSG